MANTYLSRTPSSNGSKTTNTISLWVKRGNLSGGTVQRLFSQLNTGASGNPDDYITFDDVDRITFQFYGNGSSGVNNGVLTTNRKFRDTSAWYHIVAVQDTTNGTSGDRLRIYINGVRETSFSSSTYPSQNTQGGAINNTNYSLFIGQRGNNAGYFSGSMSHINFIDGTAYDPTAFGETDATTGEWKIKTSPSVTYGTNGFFILKDGNSVTDQSGRGNNFTVGGGTLTKTEDCPSNVFACGNVLGSGSVSFSNGNNTVHEGGTSFKTAIATLGASSGKYYAEVKAPSIGSVTYGLYTGFVNLDKTNLPNLTSNVGDTADSAGISSGGGYIYYNGQQFTGATTATTANDVVNLAMDLDNGFLYWGINGTYLNSGNPASGASGTGGMPIANITAGGTYTFAVSVRSSATINFNFGNGYFGTTAVASAGTNASGIGIFEYDVPANFTALSTKGLNL